eukprot:m.214811 g.214811  ORF g.214811 m.214811 type:complete len:298 (+) comp19081_c0_seq1:153-1046(+)
MEAKSPVKGLAYGAIASCLAEMATMPIDVVKTRLQFSGADGKKAYSGAIDCVSKTIKGEGVGALFKGLPPALVRQACYGGLRYGLYAPIRNQIGVSENTPKDQIPLYKKFIAGGMSGAIASYICVPTDLMKVRLQLDGMKPGSVKQYNGMADCMRQIVKQDGLTGMWRGSGPTIGRATVLAAVEMSSYDEIKTQLIQRNVIVPGTVSGVFITALASGFFCAVFSSPFDVVKSRVMGQPVGADGAGKLYKGMIDCFVKSVRNEGALSLWKGFFPNWGRLGPRGVICFLTMETLNKYVG